MFMNSIRFARLALAGIAIGLLAACAAPAEPGRMTAQTVGESAALPPTLRGAFCVGTVTGGERTNPLWTSQVGNDEFRQALNDSLASNGYLGAAPCRFTVDANMLGLSQPIAGLDMEVTAHVNYRVGAAGQPPLLQETITSRFTATFSDSPVGVIRLQRANEGAIRASITALLQRLRAVTPPR